MDGSKSCTFLFLKYALIITLVVNLINLIVAIPTGLSAIEEEEIGDQKDKSSARKVILIAYRASNILIVVLGLVGIAKENFCLSLTVAILMSVEAVAAFFTEKTATDILAIVFNIMIAALTYAFAFLARSRNVVTHSQVEPMHPVA